MASWTGLEPEEGSLHGTDDEIGIGFSLVENGLPGLIRQPFRDAEADDPGASARGGTSDISCFPSSPAVLLEFCAVFVELCLLMTPLRW